MFEGEGLMSQYLRGFVQLAALAVAGACCLMVAACGSGSSAAAGGASGASASASATPDPLASLSANKIATEAIANLKAASSATIDGSFFDSGQAYTLHLGLKPGKGCTGSISTGSKGSFKLIVIGKTLYLDPDDAFWKANGGSAADSIIALVNGRYIKTTTSGSMGQLAQLCDLSQVIASSFKIDGTLTKGTLTTLGGVKVLPLSQGTQGTMLVTDTAKPEIVEIKSPKDSSGSGGDLNFSPGALVTLTAPLASQVIEGSAVGL
jgi:hypothetical protein